MVKRNLGEDINIKIEKTNDNRSYHICSTKFSNITKFKYSSSIEDAIKDLKSAFQNKKFSDPLSNKLYFNIKMMNSIKLN